MSEWIDVNDRLPPINEPVLVFEPESDIMKVKIDEWVTYYECPVSFSTATIEVGEGWSASEFEEITHWMPLPAPPTSSAHL